VWGPLWDLPQPSVVALHGYALAAGLEMALLCDIRLAARDTVLGLPETRLGMLPAAGGTQSLARVVGPVAALPIVATAANLSAEEAAARGIVHRVVDDVESEAMAVARRWARLDPAPLRAARRALRAAGDLPLAQGLELEGELARRA
jgi:enoyl-CoA hydratase/carnithine racemase